MKKITTKHMIILLFISSTTIFFSSSIHAVHGRQCLGDAMCHGPWAIKNCGGKWKAGSCYGDNRRVRPMKWGVCGCFNPLPFNPPNSKKHTATQEQKASGHKTEVQPNKQSQLKSKKEP